MPTRSIRSFISDLSAIGDDVRSTEPFPEYNDPFLHDPQYFQAPVSTPPSYRTMESTQKVLWDPDDDDSVISQELQIILDWYSFMNINGISRQLDKHLLNVVFATPLGKVNLTQKLFAKHQHLILVPLQDKYFESKVEEYEEDADRISGDMDDPH
ncbi:uncharacterized protein LY89DRAFT_736922 [Mollisia scopiformis]|uniref:Uncharacterized protein n=1 Tax=Mollisia scopiformis TaxID=149040 RepID=A0A194X1R8_MOLSC|nr:uncharacterized protein LY89DRAFT_736922 [Mollisia scopiformis]KUJ13924.1 hypothetical protein LY89DRAFT_736922 [Mollisia scopiformis]